MLKGVIIKSFKSLNHFFLHFMLAWKNKWSHANMSCFLCRLTHTHTHTHGQHTTIYMYAPTWTYIHMHTTTDTHLYRAKSVSNHQYCHNYLLCYLWLPIFYWVSGFIDLAMKYICMYVTVHLVWLGLAQLARGL